MVHSVPSWLVWDKMESMEHFTPPKTAHKPFAQSRLQALKLGPFEFLETRDCLIVQQKDDFVEMSYCLPFFK